MLPAFSQHESHRKLERLDDRTLVEPHPFVRAYLATQAARLGLPPARIRVLDIGCGRGDTVAWLCREGWDAYGVDVVEEYVGAGRPYFTDLGLGRDRLRLASGATYPFDAGSFDVLLSDQVFEHLENLPAVAAEMARISRPGSRGLHIFPARWRPIEVHLGVPFVHWLPKGAMRRRALRPLIAAHLAVPYFSEYSTDERVSIYATFSDTETFYRPIAEIRRLVEAAGFACDFTAARAKVHCEIPQIPRAVLPFAAAAYQTFFTVCLETTRAG